MAVPPYDPDASMLTPGNTPWPLTPVSPILAGQPRASADGWAPDRQRLNPNEAWLIRFGWRIASSLKRNIRMSSVLGTAVLSAPGKGDVPGVLSLDQTSDPNSF